MKMVNLSINSLAMEQDADHFEKYMATIPEELQIVLLHNNTENKYKEKLKKKFKKNIQM